MASVFMRKGQMVGGIFVPAGMAVYGLSASEAALAAQGGDGLVIPDPDAVSGGGIVAVGADVTINSANASTYNGKNLIFSAAWTVTLAAGLPTDFGFSARPPASGNASIASANTGGLPTLDGATTTATRALASNKLFAVVQIAADTYTVTGS